MMLRGPKPLVAGVLACVGLLYFFHGFHVRNTPPPPWASSPLQQEVAILMHDSERLHRDMAALEGAVRALSLENRQLHDKLAAMLRQRPGQPVGIGEQPAAVFAVEQSPGAAKTGGEEPAALVQKKDTAADLAPAAEQPAIGSLVPVPSSLDHVPKCSWSTGVYPMESKPATQTAWEGFTKAAKAAGLVYWMADGAGLGAIRHGGPIPHDGDMDVVVPVWYQPKVQRRARCGVALLRILLEGVRDETALGVGASASHYPCCVAWLRPAVNCGPSRTSLPLLLPPPGPSYRIAPSHSYSAVRGNLRRQYCLCCAPTASRDCRNVRGCHHVSRTHPS